MEAFFQKFFAFFSFLSYFHDFISSFFVVADLSRRAWVSDNGFLVIVFFFFFRLCPSIVSTPSEFAQTYYYLCMKKNTFFVCFKVSLIFSLEITHLQSTSTSAASNSSSSSPSVSSSALSRGAMVMRDALHSFRIEDWALFG